MIEHPEDNPAAPADMTSQTPSPPVLSYQGTVPQHGGPADSHWAPSILALVLMPPLGIVALVRAIQAVMANRKGRWDVAHRYASGAVAWSTAAFLSWLFVLFVGGTLAVGC